MIKLFRLPELHVPISFIFVGFYRNLNERDIFKWRYFDLFYHTFCLVFFLHSFRRKYFSVSPNQWSVWNVKFTCNTARLSLSCFFFLPGVATGGGGLIFWGRRGKCVVCGENGKNTVMKRGAESVTKIFAFEILPYSLIFWQTNVLVDCGVNRNRQK